MNEKIFLSCILLLCLCFFSCRTTNSIVDTADVIAGNAYAAGRIEKAVDGLDRTIDDSRERVATIIERSREITDGLDRIEYLLIQYEYEVDRILGEITGIRDAIAAEESVDNSAVYNSWDISVD